MFSTSTLLSRSKSGEILISVGLGNYWTGAIAERHQILEPLDPVVAVSGEHLLPAAVDVRLDAVAVEFDFMKPQRPYRSLGLQGGKLGLDESGHRGLGTPHFLPNCDPGHTLLTQLNLQVLQLNRVSVDGRRILQTARQGRSGVGGEGRPVHKKASA